MAAASLPECFLCIVYQCCSDCPQHQNLGPTCETRAWVTAPTQDPPVPKALVATLVLHRHVLPFPGDLGPLQLVLSAEIDWQYAVAALLQGRTRPGQAFLGVSPCNSSRLPPSVPSPSLTSASFPHYFPAHLSTPYPVPPVVHGPRFLPPSAPSPSPTSASFPHYFPAHLSTPYPVPPVVHGPRFLPPSAPSPSPTSASFPHYFPAHLSTRYPVPPVVHGPRSLPPSAPYPFLTSASFPHYFPAHLSPALY